MKRLILSMVAVLALATAVVGCGGSNTSSSDKTELEGTWTMSFFTETLAFTFNGNHWTFKDTNASGSFQLVSGTFTIDPTANPKTIDMVFTSIPFDMPGTTVSNTSLGIYELSGNTLKLEMEDSGEARPSAFNESDSFILTNQSLSSNTPSSGKTELEGTWTMTFPPAPLAFTFNGNHFTFTDTNASGSFQVASGTFTIDPTANPRTIDMYFVSAGDDQNVLGKTIHGIYQIGGNYLMIEMGDAGDARPTAFTEDDSLTLTKQ